MMNMIERLALAAIDDLQNQAEERGDWFSVCNGEIEYEGPIDPARLAKVILAAAREPTEKMLTAGYASEYGPDPIPLDVAWQAMIDEALKEEINK